MLPTKKYQYGHYHKHIPIRFSKKQTRIISWVFLQHKSVSFIFFMLKSAHVRFEYRWYPCGQDPSPKKTSTGPDLGAAGCQTGRVYFGELFADLSEHTARTIWTYTQYLVSKGGDHVPPHYAVCWPLSGNLRHIKVLRGPLSHLGTGRESGGSREGWGVI